MKTLLIVDLVQSILIFIGSLFFTIGKDATPPAPASKIVPEIPPEILKELKEVSDVYKSSLDVMAEHGREILGGAAAVLFMLMFLGLLILAFRRKDGMLDTITSRPKTIRHLLDLSEDERWRYIEAKDKGDLEEQMKILEGCGCKVEECGCKGEGCGCEEDDANCFKCSDNDNDCMSERKMIKTESD